MVAQCISFGINATASHKKLLSKQEILSASDIDYSNLEEICGYQLLMCKIFEREGGFSYPVLNVSIRAVQNQGKVWLKNVKDIIEAIVSGKSMEYTLAAIPKLLSAYDIYYRICNGESANDYIRSVRLKTVGLWAKGDKSITETYLVLELLKEVKRDNKTLDRKYSMFALGVLGDWVKELKHYGNFRDIPMTEVYARLHYMIDDDLFAYLGRTEENIQKARWIKDYTLTDEKLDTLDAETVWEYIEFAQASLLFKRSDDYDNDIRHFLSKLASIEGIHPLFRQAIEMGVVIQNT